MVYNVSMEMVYNVSMEREMVYNVSIHYIPCKLTLYNVSMVVYNAYIIYHFHGYIM